MGSGEHIGECVKWQEKSRQKESGSRKFPKTYFHHPSNPL